MFENENNCNIIYSILNNEDSTVIFNYGLLLIVFIFIFSKINFSINLFIGLIFYSILIYYFYTDRKINNINETQKKNEKFNMINTSNNILKKYPQIVDLIFYIDDIKFSNIPEFNKITELFENFCVSYESCKINYSLIDLLICNLTDNKIKILSALNSLIYSVNGKQYEDKINKIKNKAEIILNNLIDELIVIHEKNIYYNGYNSTTRIIDTTNILPYNITNEPFYNKYNKTSASFNTFYN